jgi:hypothetical protein
VSLRSPLLVYPAWCSEHELELALSPTNADLIISPASQTEPSYETLSATSKL